MQKEGQSGQKMIEQKQEQVQDVEFKESNLQIKSELIQYPLTQRYNNLVQTSHKINDENDQSKNEEKPIIPNQQSSNLIQDIRNIPSTSTNLIQQTCMPQNHCKNSVSIQNAVEFQSVDSQLDPNILRLMEQVSSFEFHSYKDQSVLLNKIKLLREMIGNQIISNQILMIDFLNKNQSKNSESDNSNSDSTQLKNNNQNEQQQLKINSLSINQQKHLYSANDQSLTLTKYLTKHIKLQFINSKIQYILNSFNSINQSEQSSSSSLISRQPSFNNNISLTNTHIAEQKNRKQFSLYLQEKQFIQNDRISEINKKSSSFREDNNYVQRKITLYQAFQSEKLQFLRSLEGNQLDRSVVVSYHPLNPLQLSKFAINNQSTLLNQALGQIQLKDNEIQNVDHQKQNQLNQNQSFKDIQIIEYYTLDLRQKKVKFQHLIKYDWKQIIQLHINSEINPQDISIFIKNHQIFQNLRILYLQENIIGNQGFDTLSSHAKLFKHLTQLYLMRNQITLVTEQNVINLKKNLKLSIVDIQSNPLQNESVLNVFVYMTSVEIKKLSPLRIKVLPFRLEIPSSFNATFSQILQFGQISLFHNDCIQLLDLSSNSLINNNQFALFIENINKFSHLRRLVLDNCKIETLTEEDLDKMRNFADNKQAGYFQRDHKFQIWLEQNPLTQQSVDLIESYKKKYQNQMSSFKIFYSKKVKQMEHIFQKEAISTKNQSYYLNQQNTRQELVVEDFDPRSQQVPMFNFSSFF